MNKDKLMDALGMIDQELVADAHSPAVRKRRSPTKLVLALATALMLVFAASLTAMAAADVDAAYEMLYGFSPTVAQLVKPVNESCVENGIKMEVISAEISGSDAYIYISMEDLEGDRIDGTIDLYDSYDINRSFDSAANCERVSYDEETGKATFLIHIQTMDGKDIRRGKVTFSVGYFLSNKNIIEEQLTVDLTKVTEAENTQSIPSERFRGDIMTGEALAPVEGGLYIPARGAQITAIGYIDGRLHLQVRYDDIWRTDNHGWITLEDEHGNVLDCEEYQFWGGEREEHRLGSHVILGYPDYYQEYVWDISPEELSGCSLHGAFWLCDTLVEGDWEVTFPLD